MCFKLYWGETGAGNHAGTNRNSDYRSTQIQYLKICFDHLDRLLRHHRPGLHHRYHHRAERILRQRALVVIGFECPHIKDLRGK
jgi:hypothetical protein